MVVKVMFILKKLHFTHQTDSASRKSKATSPGTAFRLEVDDLEIRSRGITAVVGSSGSGKTTLLSVLAGFVRPVVCADGTFTFDGRDMLRRRRHAPGDVAYVFQAPFLLPSAGIVSNALQGTVVAAPRSGERSPRATEQEVRHLFEKMGLFDLRRRLWEKRATDISGGEAQRVAVLRALLTDAKAILCDEPTSSLDDFNAVQVLSALSEWSATKQRPVVWISHNLHQVAEFADHFLFIENGRLLIPRPDLRKLLVSDDPETRLGALREIVHGKGTLEDPDPFHVPGSVVSRAPTLGGGTPDVAGEAPVEADGAGTALPIAGPGSFLHWMAHDLSTESGFGRNLERMIGRAFTSAGLRRVIDLIAPIDQDGGSGDRLPHGAPRPLSALRHLVLFLLAYSRKGLAAFLFIALLQIYLALVLYLNATVYHEKELQDPAVSRITFEHVVKPLFEARRDGGKVTNLYQPALLRLQARLQATVGSTGVAAAAEKFRLFGRRHGYDNSQFHLVGDDGVCRPWTEFETVIMDHEDWILDRVYNRMVATAAAARNGNVERPRPGQMLVSRGTAQLLSERCGFVEGQPLTVEWALSDGERAAAIQLRITTVVDEMPPMYPNSPEIIVFEADYQRHLQKAQTREPPPFRVVNAYFPIEHFDQVDQYIRRHGYEPRADSREAVRTLKDIALFFGIVPPLFALATSFIILIVMYTVLDGFLELNKRVLTLFQAYGYRGRQLFQMLFLHLLPAIAVASILVLVLAFGVSAALPPRVYELLPDFDWHRDLALIIGVVPAIVCIVLFVAIMVGVWWRRTAKNLIRFLKD